MDLKFHNTLTNKIEKFEPIEQNRVRMYTCGPTVYDFVSIGNWRTYFLGDIVFRTLRYFGYETKYIMNITDVGHLTGDNDGDADTGEDRLEKAKRREGKGAWEIADFYAKDFLEGFAKLNLINPEKFTKATDHIQEQIDLVQKLEEKSLTYKTSDGIYFDVQAFEKLGFKYGELSNLDQRLAGARVEFSNEKKDARDFALWKFSVIASDATAKRDMEWPSPWGVGFPGWHIECSAMSMKYLGDQFDIHLGGEDLRSTHHPNEIAQSEGATGHSPFVKYWIHGAFLQVDGGKMGKSLGNAYNLHDILNKGFNPLALRLFYMNGHYHSPLNFTWESFEASANSFKKLENFIRTLKEKSIGEIHSGYKESFSAILTNDLNMPEAIALMWELIKDEKVKDEDKLATLIDFDKVLGLGIEKIYSEKIEIPDEVSLLVKERDSARLNKDWAKSDELRSQIEALGFEIKDEADKTIVFKK